MISGRCAQIGVKKDAGTARSNAAPRSQNLKKKKKKATI